MKMRVGKQNALPLAVLLIAVTTVGCGRPATDPALVLADGQAATAGQVSQLDSELARLDALATPEGADENVFAALKVELASMLRAQGTERFVSTPPLTAGSSAQLSWNDDTSTLSWGYCNLGDYNQNSLVEVADITPLGVNWGAQSPGFPSAFPYSAELAVVDGNSNGLIEIADITPVGQNYQVHVTAYNVYASAALADYPPDPGAGNGGAVLLGTVPFPEGPPPSGQRRMLSFTVGNPQPETYFWVRPTDGTSEGTPSNCYHLAAPANKPPVASLTADPMLGDIPMLVEFDASASSDSDGEIVKFEWDWDGANNGWVWEDSGTTSILEHTFEEIDTYPVTVRVTDDEGAMHQASVDIRATSPGNDPPVAVLTADVTAGEIPLTVNFSAIQSSDPDGLIEDYEWDLDGNGTFGEPGAEAAATGSALASYTYTAVGLYAATVRVTDNEGANDEGIQQVSVTRAPTGEWVFVTLASDDIPDLGDINRVAIAVIDGKPAVCYLQDGSFRYVYSTTANGVDSISWIDPIAIVDVSEYDWAGVPSLLDVNGSPALVFSTSKEESSAKTHYMRASTPTGTNLSDWDQLAEFPGGLVSIQMVAGNPAIVSNLADEDTLDGYDFMYIRSTTSTGSASADWSQSVLIHDDIAGLIGDLAVVDGMPAIVFGTRENPINPNEDRLRYVRSSTPTGANPGDWGPSIVISGDDYVLDWGATSLAVVDGNPAAFYISRDGDDWGYIYVRSNTDTGESAGDWLLPVNIDINITTAMNLRGFIEIDGHPAIAYHLDLDLWYRQATGNGSSAGHWVSKELVTSPGLYTRGSELCVVEGNPAMAFVDYDEEQDIEYLKYAYYDR